MQTPPPKRQRVASPPGSQATPVVITRLDSRCVPPAGQPAASPPRPLVSPPRPLVVSPPRPPRPPAASPLRPAPSATTQQREDAAAILAVQELSILRGGELDGGDDTAAFQGLLEGMFAWSPGQQRHAPPQPPLPADALAQLANPEWLARHHDPTAAYVEEQRGLQYLPYIGTADRPTAFAINPGPSLYLYAADRSGLRNIVSAANVVLNGGRGVILGDFFDNQNSRSRAEALLGGAVVHLPTQNMA